MGVLSELEPKEVFRYFEEISRIPRPSYKEDKISDYCVNFAKERGLVVYQDAYKNVIIIKEATPGYEDAEPLVLQGHLDMVCEKEPDCTIDFEKDGLELSVEGDYEITIYTSCCNADKGIYYYNTYENHRITAVDMHRENLDGTETVRYPLITGEQIEWQN